MTDDSQPLTREAIAAAFGVTIEDLDAVHDSPVWRAMRAADADREAFTRAAMATFLGTLRKELGLPDDLDLTIEPEAPR